MNEAQSVAEITLCTPEGEEPGLLGSDSRLLSPLSFLLYMPSARLMSNKHAHTGCATPGVGRTGLRSRTKSVV